MWFTNSFFKFFLLFLYCSVALTQDVNEDGSICALPGCSALASNSSSFQRSCNEERGMTMSGRCCVKLYENDAISGVDLSNCSITSLKRMIFDQAPKVEFLNLTYNPNLILDEDSFRGLRHLNVLLLPSHLGCPGNWTWFNTSWHAWNVTKRQSDVQRCAEPTNTCSQLYSLNYTCPTHSSCIDNGPGLFLCHCDPPWSGYKCLRRSNGNPIVILLSSVSSASLFLAISVWFFGRRHVSR